jgi:hypothetical protein
MYLTTVDIHQPKATLLCVLVIGRIKKARDTISPLPFYPRLRVFWAQSTNDTLYTHCSCKLLCLNPSGARRRALRESWAEDDFL